MRYPFRDFIAPIAHKLFRWRTWQTNMAVPQTAMLPWRVSTLMAPSITRPTGAMPPSFQGPLTSVQSILYGVPAIQAQANVARRQAELNVWRQTRGS